MVCGGVYDGFYGHYCLSTVVYSFAKNSWTLADSSIQPHDNSQIMAVETNDGKPLLISGRTGPDDLTTNVEAFDWATGSWTHVGNTLAAHWHCYAFQIGDSILLVGGNMPDFTNAVRGCTWYRTSDNFSWAGPSMNVARFSYPGLVYSLGISPCQDSLSVFVFGGSDTNDNPLESCEILTLGIKPNDTGNFASSLSLPSISPTLIQSSCSAADTEIVLGIIGCGSPAGRLDSVWLTSGANDNSTPFTITDARTAPRTLAMADSIRLSYQSTRESDTAELHLRYDLGSGVRDTTITVIGRVTSPLLAQPEHLHRESASAYFGAVDTLPLAVDISSAINLDSLWPYLTAITATYAWDSSVVSYASYQPPNGWTLTALASHGNSVDIGIQNGAPSASQPLDLGTALFRPRTDQLATSWVTLAALEMQVGGQQVSLCVTDNEDSHWSVKSLGVQSGVSESSLLNEKFYLYPNPAENELTFENSGPNEAAVTIYDAIGRVVVRASVAAGITGALDMHSIPSGVYFARIVSGSATNSRTIVKR